MIKITFLVSGGGGNLKFFYSAARHNLIQPIELSVIADRDCGALDFARVNGLRNTQIKYSRSNPQALQDLLSSYNADIVVTNWHKIIDSITISRFPRRMINLHYSLLPAFKGHIGMDTVAAALGAKCKFVGTTCHYINEDVDAGEIIAQSVVKADASLEEIMPYVFRSGCLCLLNGVYNVTKKPIFLSPIEQDTPFFSPSLAFNSADFTEDFWEEVGSL